MAIALTVSMRYEKIDNPWISHRWVLDEVMVDIGQFDHLFERPAFQLDQVQGCQIDSEHSDQRWLFKGFSLDLFADESEGYFLNITSEKPCWFVMWRLEESGLLAEGQIAIPHRVMLSYNEAARLLDGGEQVDQYPIDPLIYDSVKQFVDENYRPEVKKRHRPESFKGADRGVQSARKNKK